MDSFEDIQREIGVALKPLHGKKQDKKLELDAQKVVDDLFQKRSARRKHAVIESSGIEITGCQLAFDVGYIGAHHWLTSFYPVDAHAVMKTEPKAIPLGYVNGHQLYILPLPYAPAKLVARSGMGPDYESWTPMIQGVPVQTSIMFIALERAKALGYLSLLRDHEVMA